MCDYDGEGRARLREVFPDVSLADVEAATGFELEVAADLRPVSSPSPAELAALRAIDPLGVRRLEFSPDELRRTFSHGEAAGCTC
jgi:glutaconate CoA-transferase, subunit B